MPARRRLARSDALYRKPRRIRPLVLPAVSDDNPPAMKTNSLRPHSSILVDGPERAGARSMLYPVGFKEEDFQKPIIGVASAWSNVTPCNMHLDKLALEAEKGANAGGGKAIVFNTITISDGISMGT